jgi:hypothetical protein
MRYTVTAAVLLLLMLLGCEAFSEPTFEDFHIVGTWQWEDGTPIAGVRLEAGRTTCTGSWSTMTCDWSVVTWALTNESGEYSLRWNGTCEHHHGGPTETSWAIRWEMELGDAVPECPDTWGVEKCTSDPQTFSCTVRRSPN